MNNRTHIHQELQSIAPGLVALPVVMPYTLPPGYFEGLVDDVLSTIKGNPEQYPFFSKKNPYSVPVGYFENLPEVLFQRVRNELLTDKETNFKNTLPKIVPYTVPAGYFSELPPMMLRKAKGEELQQNVPTGYFENLSEQMLAKVRKLDAAKELDEVAPLLNNISRQSVQHVPTGYFENLLPVLKNSKQPVPVVPPKKSMGNSWLKYAVAASVIFLLSFGAYFLFNTKNTSIPSVANQPTVNVINEQLANLDASTIENYLQKNNAIVQADLPVGGMEELNNADLDELLKGFTDQQLKIHIEETPELPGVKNPKSHT